MIGISSIHKGQDEGYAYVTMDIPFPDSTTNWNWMWWIPGISWNKANKGLGVKGISFSFTFNSFTK